MSGWVISYANECLRTFSRQISPGCSSGIPRVQIGLFCHASLFVPDLTRKNVLSKPGGEFGVGKGWETAHPCSWVKAAVNVINRQACPMSFYTFTRRCSACSLLPVTLTSAPPAAFIDFSSFLCVSYSRHFLWHFSEVLSHCCCLIALSGLWLANKAAVLTLSPFNTCIFKLLLFLV